ncbi:MAG: hypothetical protein OCC49_12485 [Fibrobacterales bacterium]
MNRLLLLVFLMCSLGLAKQTTSVEINTLHGWSLNSGNSYFNIQYNRENISTNQFADLANNETYIGAGFGYDITVKKSINDYWGVLLSMGYQNSDAQNLLQISLNDTTLAKEFVESEVVIVPFGIGVYYEYSDYYVKPYISGSLNISKVLDYSQEATAISVSQDTNFVSSELEYDIDLGVGTQVKGGFLIPIIDNIMCNAFMYYNYSKYDVAHISKRTKLSDIPKVGDEVAEDSSEPLATDLKLLSEATMISSSWGVGIGFVYRY